jgi:3-dehydroquinate synthetase
MGLVAAANLSARLGHCSSNLQERIESALGKVGLPTTIPGTLSPESLYHAMSSDKKKIAGQLRFVLLRDVGQAFVTDAVSKQSVMNTLQAVSE